MPFFLLAFVVFGYGACFLDGVFAAAMAGEVGQVRFPGRDIISALKSGVRWLICFVAGPVIPAGLSIFYWIRCGDPAPVDWLILVELNLLALSAWFLLLLAVSHRQRLRDLNPARVVALIQRFGHRLVALALFAAAVLLAHTWLTILGLEQLHEDMAGWLWLFVGATSGMFFATFLFRWIGVWFYWERIRERPDGIRKSLARTSTANI